MAFLGHGAMANSRVILDFSRSAILHLDETFFLDIFESRVSSDKEGIRELSYRLWEPRSNRDTSTK